MYFCVKFKKIEKRINSVFIGCPFDRNFQWFYEKLTVDKCFMLDDGTRTIGHQKNLFPNGNYMQRDDLIDRSIEKNTLKRTKNTLKIF